MLVLHVSTCCYPSVNVCNKRPVKLVDLRQWIVLREFTCLVHVLCKCYLQNIVRDLLYLLIDCVYGVSGSTRTTSQTIFLDPTSSISNVPL